MQSKFSILADLGNFRHNVQCNSCGHNFVHKSGAENSINLTETQTSPLCPVCFVRDDLPTQETAKVMGKVASLAAFGIIVEKTQPDNKPREPWHVYDFSMRQSYSKTEEACIDRGKEWLEQDIGSNDYGDGMNAEQEAALKVLFGPDKAAALLAMCHPHHQE